MEGCCHFGMHSISRVQSMPGKDQQESLKPRHGDAGGDQQPTWVSSGVMTTAASVDAVVIITLRATSALARKVTTLEAVPPGQQATMQMLQGTGQHCSGQALGQAVADRQGLH